MSSLVVRQATARDRDAIRRVEVDAFGGDAEAKLVDALVAEGDVVLELVAERDGSIVGHVLFSRLMVMQHDSAFPAIALAPLAVAPDEQRKGVGIRLVEDAHRRLQPMGEALSIVVGDPSYYGRFGYEHARASSFESDFQGAAMQALAWRPAPTAGRLVYATPFGSL